MQQNRAPKQAGRSVSASYGYSPQLTFTGLFLRIRKARKSHDELKGRKNMKWTYRTCEVSFNTAFADVKVREELNVLGEEGWEALAAWPQSGSNADGKVVVLFKKPMRQPA
jgi:hypothetical protein